MKRRTVLQGMASVVALPALAPFRAPAQAPVFSAADLRTLAAVADVVLPSSLGGTGREGVVERFAAWFAGYRAGADRGHSYGDSRLQAPAPPLNLTRYPAQLAALEQAGRDQGAASLSALAPATRRPLIEAALNDPQPANRLSARPNGANVVADLMGFFYTSPQAYDLCYQAAIGRDDCRDLPGSEKAPAPLAGTGGGQES